MSGGAVVAARRWALTCAAVGAATEVKKRSIAMGRRTAWGRVEIAIGASIRGATCGVACGFIPLTWPQALAELREAWGF